MKILSIHIENFGKLHDADFSFKDGLNTICLPNGTGKSTLATFIKVREMNLKMKESIISHGRVVLMVEV